MIPDRKISENQLVGESDWKSAKQTDLWSSEDAKVERDCPPFQKLEEDLSCQNDNLFDLLFGDWIETLKDVVQESETLSELFNSLEKMPQQFCKSVINNLKILFYFCNIESYEVWDK